MQYIANSTDRILTDFDPYTVKIVVFDQIVFTYLLMIEKASRNTNTISNFW